MKKMYGLISKLLLVIIFVTRVAGINALCQVNATTYGTNTRVSQVNVSGGYFDTGIKINQDYSIEMTFALSDITQYADCYTSETSSNQKVFRLRNESTNGFRIAYGWYDGKKLYQPKVNEEITVSQKKNITYINNNQVQKATAQTMQASTTLRFGQFKGYIKSFKVWNGSNTLVASYIPVTDSSSKACMYDTVTGKNIYYTGTCKAGEIVSDSSDVESGNTDSSDDIVVDESTSDASGSASDSNGLESSNSSSDIEAVTLNGGQFDSGLKVNLNYSLEAVFSLSSTTQYATIYESYNGSSKVFYLRNESTDGFRVCYGWYGAKKLYHPTANKEITVLQNKNITYVNGNQVQKATAQTLTSSATLKFGNFKGNLMSFRIWDEANNLVAEFLPAVDSSNKACLYNTVKKSYVYYSGTCTAVGETTDKEDSDSTDSSGTENGTISGTITGSTSSSVNSSSNSSTTVAAFREELKQMILTGDMTTHNVERYGLTNDEIYAVWNDLKENECYVAMYTYYGPILSTGRNSDGIIETMFIYNADSDFANRYAKTCAAIQEFKAGIDSKMNLLDKVVYAHEYLVSNTTYENTGKYAFCAGGVLGEKKGVCQGYAYALQVLLHEMGIESYYLASTSMNHGWVMVNLNGRYYHIDPTWDDTRKGTNDVYSHRFLLRNDSEMLGFTGTNRHYDWSCTMYEGITSTSTMYTSWFVHDVAGTMYYYNGYWYYLDLSTNSIYKSTIYGGSKTVVVDGSSLSTIKLTGITSGVLKYTVGGTAKTKTL